MNFSQMDAVIQKAIDVERRDDVFLTNFRYAVCGFGTAV
jgi:hypothetical protein